MISEPPLVSVVVVTWNARDLLPECLASLRGQVLPGRRLEIILVDNGSEDDTAEFVRSEYEDVRLVALPCNLGFAGGADAGIRASAGEAVVLLNNDATADPAFIGALVDALDADPGVAAVTGLIVLADRYEAGGEGDLRAHDGTWWTRRSTGIDLVNSTGGEVTRSGNGRDRDWLTPLGSLDREAGTVAGFSGGAVALRRSAIESVGSFDTRLFMYYEDSDLSWRLRRAGWSIVFAPRAVVRHRHAASSGTKSDFFLFHNERNRILFVLKHAPLRVIALAVARTVASAVKAALRGDAHGSRRKFRALGSAARLAPAFLADRRAIDRAAIVGRKELWTGAPAD